MTNILRGDLYSSRSSSNSKSPVIDFSVLSPSGAVATQDAARVTNPTTQATASNIVNLHEVNGEHVLLVFKYDAGLAVSTNPAGGLFGRVGPSGTWNRLKNIGGSDQVAFICDTTNDVSDGTFKYASFTASTNVFDRMGFDEFTWGTETALAGTGTKTNAQVLLKPL